MVEIVLWMGEHNFVREAHPCNGRPSEHVLQRRVQSYAGRASADRLERRVRELNAEGRVDHEVAQALNAERVMSARGVSFRGETVRLLRTQWGLRRGSKLGYT